LIQRMGKRQDKGNEDEDDLAILMCLASGVERTYSFTWCNLNLVGVAKPIAGPYECTE
jgi:hypothetical protein